MKGTKTVTYHASINNGSFLQAYALQKTLLKSGYNNLIVDLQTKELKQAYSPIKSGLSLSNILKNVFGLIYFNKINKRNNLFESARKKYLKTTSLCENLDSYKKDKDIFIAGSDQIWNVNANDFCFEYFLPNVKNKISYSVSCGAKITDKDLKKYLPFIKDFNALSVRDDGVKNILEKCGVKNVVKTVDPTLLLEKEDYKKIQSKKRIIKGQYIFLYSVKAESAVYKQAKKIAKQLKMPIYTTFTVFKSYFAKYKGIKVLYDIGPCEFLTLIDNASLVLTDSFHGTVFSLLYNKKFCSISSDKNKKDFRIDGFLKDFGISHKNVSADNLSKGLDNYKLPYNQIEKKRALLKENSKKWLKDTLDKLI